MQQGTSFGWRGCKLPLISCSVMKRLTGGSAWNERKGSVKASGFGFGSFCRCKKTVECVACLLSRWNRSLGTGLIGKGCSCGSFSVRDRVCSLGETNRVAGYTDMKSREKQVALIRFVLQMTEDGKGGCDLVFLTGGKGSRNKFWRRFSAGVISVGFAVLDQLVRDKGRPTYVREKRTERIRQNRWFWIQFV